MSGSGRPVRKNIAKISLAERDRFKDVIIKLNQKFYPGSKDDFRPENPGPYRPPGHVSYWFKQDEIHQATHVHGGPAFLPWHRELCNRFEDLLQEIDPKVALHYWDWQTDPRASPDGKGNFVNLFTAEFMGSAQGRVGRPLETFDNNGVADASRDITKNPADPPGQITRDVNGSDVGMNNDPGAPNILQDEVVLSRGDNGPIESQFQRMRTALEGSHNIVHTYIGGDLSSMHNSFRDPFVFLLHSDLDRLWASWQRKSGQEWRLDLNRVYGNESNTTAQGHVVGILTPLEPWAGIDASGIEDEVKPARPWATPENEQKKPENQKDSRQLSVVVPPEYDEYVTIRP
jgi:hypothetical protein